MSQLDKIGVRFLSGWAIPNNQIQFVFDMLTEIKTDFWNAKDVFINNYDLAVKDWVYRHPGWEKLIEASPVDASEVRGRFRFNWQFYKVVPPNELQIADSLRIYADFYGIAFSN